MVIQTFSTSLCLTRLSDPLCEPPRPFYTLTIHSLMIFITSSFSWRQGKPTKSLTETSEYQLASTSQVLPPLGAQSCDECRFRTETCTGQRILLSTEHLPLLRRSDENRREKLADETGLIAGWGLLTAEG
jgi:hypothetical protein